MESRDAVTVKQLQIDGKDLLELGVQRGPQIGEILDELLKLVMEDPSMNQKDVLLEEARKAMGS